MNLHGDFIWYELLTSDPEAAAGFFGKVLGWTANVVKIGDWPPYHVMSAAGANTAGIMACPDGDVPVAWLGYIGVDDVDAAAAAITADGGRQLSPAMDIEGVGRFAVLADPQGVALGVMRGASGESSAAFDTQAVGHCNWNEIATPDPVAGLAFYSRHFGWQKGDSMAMGEMGDYQFITHAGRTIGAIMALQPGPRPPSFLFYFGVADIDVAAAAVKEGGGTLIHGPGPIPGDMFIIVALDPQGAAFGLVGPRR